MYRRRYNFISKPSSTSKVQREPISVSLNIVDSTLRQQDQLARTETSREYDLYTAIQLNTVYFFGWKVQCDSRFLTCQKTSNNEYKLCMR